MAKVTVLQGEAKLLPFRIRNKVTGQPMNLTGARFILWAKRGDDDIYVSMIKSETDFDTSAAASGFVTVFLTPDDTYLEPWIYMAELRVTMGGSPTPIEKLQFELEILPAITPTDLNSGMTGICSLESCGIPTVSG